MGISTADPTTLIVLAHPGWHSFNAAWANTTAAAGREHGHDVLWSDLAALDFDAIEDPEHYAEPTESFDLPKTQEQAAAGGKLPANVQREVEKLEVADLVVFHISPWWFAPPALLKGWFQRAQGGLLRHHRGERH